nr:PAS domain-containing protein [Planctomycetota bacterium]
MGDTRKTKAQLLNELQSLRGRLVGEAADPAAQTQEYLYEMFDGAAHAAFVVGTDFTVLHANQALVDMTGLKRERILGSKCCQTIGKSRCKSDSCALHQVFSGTDRIGPLMIRDICGRDDSGSMLTAWAVRDGDSKVKGACVELDARAEQMRAILALMEGIAIAIYDLDGMILAVWSNNEECYGISLDDLRGKTLRDVYPPELAEARIDRIRQAATAPEPLRDVYYAPLPASGRWLETAWSPIREAAGNASSEMGLSRDITA